MLAPWSPLLIIWYCCPLVGLYSVIFFGWFPSAMASRPNTLSSSSGSVASGSVDSAATLGTSTGLSFGQNMPALSSIRLTGHNYSPWARSVQMTLRAMSMDYLLTDDPPTDDDPRRATWRATDANILVRMWGCIEPSILTHVVYSDTTKGAWELLREMFSGVDNLRRTYDLHQSFFSLAMDGSSLEDFYGRFRAVCDELDMAEPVTADVTVMRRQRDSMRVARFLSALPSSFEGARSQILSSKALPPLSEVFHRLRQTTIPTGAPLPVDRSALAASAPVYRPPAPPRIRGPATPRDSRPSSRSDRDSGGGGDALVAVPSGIVHIAMDLIILSIDVGSFMVVQWPIRQLSLMVRALPSHMRSTSAFWLLRLLILPLLLLPWPKLGLRRRVLPPIALG